MKRALCLTVLALSGAPGCVRETRPEHAPAYAHPVTAYGWVAPAMPSGPHYASLAPPPPAAFTPASAPAPAASRPDVPTFQSSELPSGDACVAELTRLGVGFSRLDEKRGIATPVEVVGKINGIRYQSGTSTYMLADCRLVLALHRVAPVLSDLGVTTVRFSGAYSYRMSRVGRLSLHAHGLALDVHEVQFGTSWQSVERDFARGLPDGCAAQSPLLNQLGWRLRATHLFKELLTPDYDADHHNHCHLAIAPVDAPKAEPAKPPKPARPKPKSAPKPAPKPAPAPEPALAPEPAPAPDDGEPTVEPWPEEAPPPAKPETKPARAKAKPKHAPTRPAGHRPAAKRARPAAS